MTTLISDAEIAALKAKYADIADNLGGDSKVIGIQPNEVLHLIAALEESRQAMKTLTVDRDGW